jgi:uncharacterized protein involved in exopolysaccharide biosynthesis
MNHDHHQDPGLAAELRAGIDRLAAITRRRGRTFIVLFAIAVACMQAIAFVWPGTYEAKAAVLLQKTRFAGSIDADPTQPTVVAGSVSEEEVNSEIAVLTSQQTLDATMKATGLDTIPPPWYLRLIFAPLRGYERLYSWMHETPYPTQAERALAGLAKSIDVQRLKESNILVVSYRAGDPKFAEIVLDELLKQYLAWHVSVHSSVAVEPFFTTQAEHLNQELTELQSQLQKLKKPLGVADLQTEREIAMRQHASLREEELLLRRQVRELDAKIVSVRETTSKDEGWTRMSTTTKPSSQAAENLRAQILQLELEEIRLDSRFTADSPLVKENQAKLAAARKALEVERNTLGEESTTGINPTFTTLRQESARYAAERAGLESRLEAITAQLADSQTRLSRLDAASTEGERIEVQLKSAKERYLMYLERTEKARVDAALDQSRVANVSIVQSASAPLKPVSPKRLITLIVSVVAGLVIALLVCAWLELSEIGVVGVLAAATPRGEVPL